MTEEMTLDRPIGPLAVFLSIGDGTLKIQIVSIICRYDVGNVHGECMYKISKPLTLNW